MKNFLVVIGLRKHDDDCFDQFSIKFYKVSGETLEQVIYKIKNRTSHWKSLDVDAYIMEVLDLEQIKDLRREVEFLGNFWINSHYEEKEKGQ